MDGDEMLRVWRKMFGGGRCVEEEKGREWGSYRRREQGWEDKKTKDRAGYRFDPSKEKKVKDWNGCKNLCRGKFIVSWCIGRVEGAWEGEVEGRRGAAHINHTLQSQAC